MCYIIYNAYDVNTITDHDKIYGACDSEERAKEICVNLNDDSPNFFYYKKVNKIR